jgi:hypothetical protein
MRSSQYERYRELMDRIPYEDRSAAKGAFLGTVLGLLDESVMEKGLDCLKSYLPPPIPLAQMQADIAAAEAAQPKSDNRPLTITQDLEGNWIGHRAGDPDNLRPCELRDRP